ncbi:hypothetical protein MMC34_006777 [Xylographa carneopallida]|nr:hypothetical protein [Xylographa carneopallida]
MRCSLVLGSFLGLLATTSVVDAQNLIRPHSVSDAAILARDPPTPAETSLQQWFETTVYSFFPNDTTWPPHFDAAFARNASCSFNQPHYSTAGLKALYYEIQAAIAAGYNDFALQFTSVTAVPNADDLGGIVTATGVDVATFALGGESTAPDAVFAVVSEIDGMRLITEWRESSDFVFKS